MANHPLSDMLTRIRNGQRARHAQVTVPFSKIHEKILQIFKDEGLIREFRKSEKNAYGIDVELKYHNNNRLPVIQYIQSVTTPGRRVYVKSHELAPVRNGMGIGILTTPKGILTIKQAAQQKVGGEYLCKVW